MTNEWVPEEQLEELDQAKLLGLRIITHRSLGFCRDKNAAFLAKDNLEMLAQVLEKEGMISDETMEG